MHQQSILNLFLHIKWHYDITYGDFTYNDFTYNDFTYNDNTCNTLYMFHLLNGITSNWF